MTTTLFIIESEEAAPSLLGERMARLSHKVLAAVPVKRALDMTLPEPPDLILVEVSPGDEARIVEAVRRVRLRLSAPVIYITTPESLSKLDLEEPVGFLVKPVDPQVVEAVFRTTLHCHRTQEQSRLGYARLQHVMDDLAEAQALSNVGSWDQDLATGELHISDVCRKIHGIPEEGHPVLSVADLLVHAADEERRKATSLVEEVRRTGNSHEAEYRLEMPDGSLKTMHQRIALRHDATGRPTHILSTVQDITERTRYEEALRQSQERASHLLRERDFILEHTRDILYYIDSQGSIYYISPAVEELTGFTPDEWKGPFVAHFADTPNNRRVIQESLETLRTGREWPPSHVDILHKGGHIVIAEVSERAIIEGGKVIGIVGVARDITERRQAEHRLRQAAAVFENTHEAIVITDAERRITAVNRAFTEITGFSEADVSGKSVDAVSAGAEEPHFRDQIWATVANSGRWTGEMWQRRKSGELFPAWVAINTVKDERDSVTQYVALWSDLSRIRESEDKLEQLAHYDPLTRLPNRLLFHSRLAHALRTAERRRREIAVLFIDLDHFKNINDTLGHPAGDRLLKEVAMRLAACLRKEDTIAHLGGDEFVTILENVKDLRYVVDVAQKILAFLGRPYELDGHEAVISASMGIAIYPRDGTDVTRLVQNADTAMYRAKETGRGRFQFYTSELTSHAVERMAMAGALRGALQRDEFVLFYQPQISLRTGEVTGVEALLRWRHPERGLLLPKAFVPLGEEIGMISAMGEWVLRNACMQAREWMDAGARPFTLAINLSMYQLVPNDHFVEQVADTLRETAVDPHGIEFEITESAIMRNAEEATGIIKALKKLGLRIAIDDFGTGYSSMSYLKYFDVDRLKVDSSFIHDIPSDPSDQAIAEAIIALGHSLQMRVIAEGVETEQQRTFLRDHGCDEMQGFLFSPAVTGPECKEILLH